jgi:hypothetical protein
VGDLFDGYQRGVAWDEVFASNGRPHEAAQAVHEAFSQLSAEDLAGRSVALARAFRDQGITFSLFGEERPFPLDLVPRIIDADEWDFVERGVTQRVKALEAFLADMAGEQAGAGGRHRAAAPWCSSSAHTRHAHGVVPPERRARARQRHRPDPRRAGRVPRPGGTTCARRRRQLRRENRRAMTRVFPSCSAPPGPAGRRLPGLLLRALKAAAPPGCRRPDVVCSPRASTTAPTSSTRCSPG